MKEEIDWGNLIDQFCFAREEKHSPKGNWDHILKVSLTATLKYNK